MKEIKNTFSRYTPQHALRAKELMRSGATTFEVAKDFGVPVWVIRNWMYIHPEFAACFRLGGALADNRVELSLFEIANGYTYEEEIKIKEFDPQTGTEVEKISYITKHIPPNIAAIKHYLGNRRGNKWKEKSEVTHHHNVTVMSDAELLQIVNDNAIDGEFIEVEKDE